MMNKETAKTVGAWIAIIALIGMVVIGLGIHIANGKFLLWIGIIVAVALFSKGLTFLIVKVKANKA